MLEESATSNFEVFSPSPEKNCELAPDPAAHNPEVRSRSAAEIAKAYNVSDKTVQLWFKAIAAAYCWLEPEALKTGKSAKTRYTPLCQQLIAEYRSSAASLSESDWIASVHAAHPDERRSRLDRFTPQTATPAITPEILPSESSVGSESDTDDEFYVPTPNWTIVPTRKIRMPNTADDFDFGSALARLGGNQGLAVSDSKRLVDAAEQLLNGMAAALEQKVDQQAESLHSDLVQLQRLEETKLDFLRRTSFAARQAKDLASRQTEVTEELTTTYHEIASLGKPLENRRASGQ